MRGTGRSTTAWVAAVLMVAGLAIAAACRNEEDPNYWIAKLEEPAWRDEALRRLDRMFGDLMRENRNDRAAPPVASFIDTVGGALIKAYQAGGSGSSEDIASRNKIVGILSQMENPAAMPVYISALEEISGTKIERANTAAEAIARFCRGPNSKFPPPVAQRDKAWTERCASADPAVPALAKVIDIVNAQRSERGANAENISDEDALVSAAVSAIGNILLANPQSQHRELGSKTLVSALETPDTAQDLQINMLALMFIGRLGDTSAAPLLVRTLFVAGKRRPVALQEIARVALQQGSDLDAVAAALVKAARMEDSALNEMQQNDQAFDVRLIKEQVSITLGLLGVTSEPVTTYLTEELNHSSEDDFDRTPSRGQYAFTAKLSAAHRRAWAAQALAKMRYEPALATITKRLALRNGELADRSLDLVEVPGYLDAAGDYLMPDRTNEALLTWALEGDEGLRDRAARRLALQGDADLAPRLEERAQKMRECDPALKGCVRRNFLEDYVPTLRAAEGCTTLVCWTEKLRDKAWRVRERAAYSLAAKAYGNDAEMDQARLALLGALGDTSEKVINAAIFALNRVSPRGCDEACLNRLDEAALTLQERQSMNEGRRGIEGLRGILAYRASAAR